MKKVALTCTLLLISCTKIDVQKNNYDFVIAFGSCNNQNLRNPFWHEIIRTKPNVWIWGGDNIYADTSNLSQMKKEYAIQWQQPNYKEFAESIPILGIWDDHDYGLNDGGYNFSIKRESQQVFLDFLQVPSNDDRRNKDGIYHSQSYSTQKGIIKVILLDTRFFRTELTVDPDTNPLKIYKPNNYGKGTILGKKQWQWLETELNESNADFNIIVSSIQFLSSEHGWEKWNNFPHELDRLKKLLKESIAKRIILLSGDRHMSEFSRVKTKNNNFLVDFTSSGLTHTTTDFDNEYNPNRIGEVINVKNFGLLKFNFDPMTVTFQMVGEKNRLLQEHIENYN